MLKVIRTLRLARPLISNTTSILASNTKPHQIQTSNFHGTVKRLGGGDHEYVVCTYLNQFYFLFVSNN